MITHYFKIAFRNLTKYRTHTLISIIGLSIGFTCFALASLWINYETSYDSFHRKADLIYCLLNKDDATKYKHTPYSSSMMPAYLTSTFPEIEVGASIQAWKHPLIKDTGEKYDDTYMVRCDSNFLNLFNIQIIEGNIHFPNRENEIAVTEELAKRLWGNESAIGKKILQKENPDEFTITAIIKGWGKHSNLPFDYLVSTQFPNNWSNTSFQIFFRLKQGTDSESFIRKLEEHQIKETFGKRTATPLTKLHNICPNQENYIHLEYVRLFAVIGGLLIICALLNYLSLFISRIFIRQREIALRVVCGSSGWKIMKMLFFEYLLLMLCALFFGMLLIELLLPYFRDITQINSSTNEIYREVLLYIAIVVVASLLLSVIPIYYFCYRTLNISIIEQSNNKRKQYFFQKACVIVQLCIGIGFIFCTTVMIKQLYTLRNTDVGFKWKDVITVSPHHPTDIDALAAKIKQIPSVTDVMAGSTSFFPIQTRITYRIDKWENKQEGQNVFNIDYLPDNGELLKFSDITIIEGRYPHIEEGPEKVIINESAVNTMGWSKEKAIGKHFYLGGKELTVIGVIKDFYRISPTTPATPFAFVPNSDDFKSYSVVLKHQPGVWKECEQQLISILDTMYPQKDYTIYVCEKLYNKMLHSEDILLRLILIISIVCIWIALFGIYSSVSLTCQKRRKEIAIRKVNGARIIDILWKFITEYTVLFIISIAIAFPIAYICMKPWVEQYVIQTSISAWLYPAISIGVITIIVLCIGWKVWQAATNNPAEEVRKE